jgi:hypothetical protein
MFYLISSVVRNESTRYNYIKRPLWIIMAVFCIVFSSASKKLIELHLAPYITVAEASGKKIKDGCRDRRQHLNAQVVHQASIAPDGSELPQFFISAFLTAAALLLAAGFVFKPSPRPGSAQPALLPLFIRHRNLRI